MAAPAHLRRRTAADPPVRRRRDDAGRPGGNLGSRRMRADRGDGHGVGRRGRRGSAGDHRPGQRRRHVPRSVRLSPPDAQRGPHRRSGGGRRPRFGGVERGRASRGGGQRGCLPGGVEGRGRRGGGRRFRTGCRLVLTGPASPLRRSLPERPSNSISCFRTAAP